MRAIDFESFSRTSGWIQRIDPRLRLVILLFASVAAAIGENPEALLCGLAMALLLAFSIKLPPVALARRLIPINIFMLMLVLIMPLSIPGPSAATVGDLHWSWPGLVRALTLMVRGNIIILLMTALVSTMDMSRLGRGLAGLHVPQKLVAMLIFSVRYHHVLLEQYRCLIRAARVRGFVGGVNLHSYRTIGQLVGMLLVRSVERSSRILWAMKCRGYHGSFHYPGNEKLIAGDYLFVAAAVTAFAALAAISFASGG